MTPREFVRKWKAATLKERSAAQEHFLDLGESVGHGKPAALDPQGEFLCLKEGAEKGGGCMVPPQRVQPVGRKEDLHAGALSMSSPPARGIVDITSSRCLGRWAAAALAGMLAASAAHPCSCSTPSLQDALAAADAVFVGKVIRLEVAEEKEFFDELRITIETVTSVKGEVASTTKFYADNFCCGSCDSNPFEIAKTYLIFARALGEDYASGACSRTAEIALAGEDLKALGIDPERLMKRKQDR